MMMYVCLISFGTLLLLVDGAQSPKECSTTCAETQTNEKAISACKEGCRLQVIFAFASNSDVTSAREECYNGCSNSYEDHMEKKACSFGCDNQPDMKKSRIRVSITNESPTFQVARKAMEKMMHRIGNSFPSFGDLGLPSSSEEHDERFWEDPFAQLHLRMQNEMARFQQIAQNMLNLQRTQAITPVVTTNHRPEGHAETALRGPLIGNHDKNGEQIIEAQPVDSVESKFQSTSVHQEENPTVTDIAEPSLLTRVTLRARRLSVLSQWLVCVALFLCLVSMLSISVAILKQIKSQKYQNLRSTHVVVPPSYAEPLPAKKIPLESSLGTNEYPLIHDSPPPAYDQLSVRKEKVEDGTDDSAPKV